MISVSTFIPHPDKVFVSELETGAQQTKGGILLPDDNMTDRGIRPRWARVVYVGANVTEVQVDEFVLVEHGRWSFHIDIGHPDGRMERIWQIDLNDTLGASDTDIRNNQMVSL